MSYKKAIFGDNQFLGVNHANQAKAAELFKRFNDPDAIIEILGIAYEAGVRDFMFTTHDRYESVFEEIRRSKLFPGMHYTPCIPYAHKYWNEITYHGPFITIFKTISKTHANKLVPSLLQMLIGNTRGITRLLVDIEIFMSRGLPVRGVFILNLAFDFLVSMELFKVIEQFAEIITNKLGVIPGFFTMNHPIATDILCDNIGLVNPWICSNYNIAGFRMNPSKVLCEESFSRRRSQNIAMSIMASGGCEPNRALNFVVDKLNSGSVSSILFGSANRTNIQTNMYKILNS